MPKTAKKSTPKPTQPLSASKLHRLKKQSQQLHQWTFSHKEVELIEGAINRVLELRKIESLKQIYQQLPQIKQYVYDSYEFGELSQVAHKPNPKLLELLIEKQYR